MKDGDLNPSNTTDSPSWSTITRIRDRATRKGGGVPMHDRCNPDPIRYEGPEIEEEMVGFTNGCGSEGTMVLVPYAPDPDEVKSRAGIARTCVDCDAVYLWPRFAPGVS